MKLLRELWDEFDPFGPALLTLFGGVVFAAVLVLVFT